MTTDSDVEELRSLLGAVVGLVEGCHDCINYSGDEDLWARLRAAGVWGEETTDA